MAKRRSPKTRDTGRTAARDDGLKEYRAKRTFDRTPEPAHAGGAQAAAGSRPRFVVQKHGARRLHYDLRLELDGVLKSWAVPKGPSPDPAAKPLAVQVEDHPLDYSDFEGVIPEGEYGAGPMIVWDRGGWEPLADPHEGLRKGDFKFRLHGERLRGDWALIRMRTRDNDGRNWLLIKKKGEGAGHFDLLAPQTSVISGRTLDDLRSAAPRKPKRIRIVGARPPAEARSVTPGAIPAAPTGSPAPRPVLAPARVVSAEPQGPLDPSRLPHARRAEFPADPRPQLAESAEKPPAGDRWLHEVKFDGYRLMCVIKDGRVRLLTRSGQDWTATFRPIANAAARLPFREAVVDGEVVVLDSRGVSDFQALQNTVKAKVQGALVYFAFDLPFAEGWDLRACALADRKELLHAALKQVRGGARSSDGPIRYSDHVVGRGEAVFREAEAAGLEGIVSKRLDGPYESRRTSTWLKIKARREADFVIVGYTGPEGTRVGLGALVLARPQPGNGLIFCGKVGTGFDTKTLIDLHGRLSAIERKSPPIPLPKNPEDRKGVRWVEPLYVANVEYGMITRDGYVRHAVYHGLRLDLKPEDVPPGECLPPDGHDTRSRAGDPDAGARESAAPAGGGGRAGVVRAAVVRPSSRPGAAKVGGVEITNADRVVYPGIGVTKRRVAEYYHSVAERMLPFIAGRPLSVIRAPKGLAEPTFFQRHPMESMPRSVKVVHVAGHAKRYIQIDDADGLLTLVQFGALEFHPWACRSEAADRADILTFDLDPGEGVPWEGLRAAALALREMLLAEGLESFVKTSGGKGLHVVIPVTGERGSAPDRGRRRGATARTEAPGVPWSTARKFDEEIGARIVGAAPTRFTTNVRADRRGKIYVDYLRNRSAATSVAAYSLRARPNAPVSMPLSWEELPRSTGPSAFTIGNAAERLRGADPWRGFFRTGNRLGV